jgi:hypothetical protein
MMNICLHSRIDKGCSFWNPCFSIHVPEIHNSEQKQISNPLHLHHTAVDVHITSESFYPWNKAQTEEWSHSIWIKSISDICRSRSHTHTHQCMYVLVPPTTIGTRSLARTISVAALASLKNCPTVYSASWIHHHTSGNKAKFPQCTYLWILKP